MASASSDQVLQASRQWLQPLIKVLLNCGISWREFAELSRNTYVEVATRDFGKRGRPTNVSRTAILTGLTRKDVRKQRTNMSQAPAAPAGYITKAARLLSAWHLSPEFHDKNGRPAVLRMAGPTKSFEALLAHVGGSDVPPTTLLKELVGAGAVRVRKDGRLQMLKHYYVPRGIDEQLIRLWGTVISDVAAVYVHNLTAAPNVAKRLERSAVNDRMPPTVSHAFAQMLEKEGQALLERVDRWLTEHERPPEDTAGETVRLGVGMYQIQDP
jgi:hypothetical protein